MFRYIVMPSTGSAADIPVLHTALIVARTSNAHIFVLHTCPDIMDAVIGLAPAAGPGYDEMIGRIERRTARRREEAERRFRVFCEMQGLMVAANPANVNMPSAELHQEVGDELWKLAEYGRTSDLVVLGRVHDDPVLARLRLETAIMDTGRPVLIASNNATPADLDTIAIAWKDTVESAKAVSAAVPFIERAERVVVLTVPEGQRSEQRSATRLLEALRYHNRSVTLHELAQQDRPAVETMLDWVTSEAIGLLVMGAYGHSRVRELVLGGFTRHVLNAVTPTVLMAH
jgi:nucleotide-binding universal stress UspA family protein